MLTSVQKSSFVARHLVPGDDTTFCSILASTPMIQDDLVLHTHLPFPIENSLSQDRNGLTKAILFEDVGGAAHGCASLSYWEGDAISKTGLRAETPESKLCYLGDLRFKNTMPRELRLGWRGAYRDLVTDLLDPQAAHAVQGVVTSVLDHNVRAANALLRGRDGIVYESLFKYTTYSFPFFQGPSLGTIDASESESEWLVSNDQVVNTASQAPFVFRSGINRKWQINGQDLLSAFAFCSGPIETEQDIARLMSAARQHAKSTRQEIFQIALIGEHAKAFEMHVAGRLQFWKTSSTLYRVYLDDLHADNEFPFVVNPNALTIDPTQL
jgi:hypothetical protein